MSVFIEDIEKLKLDKRPYSKAIEANKALSIQRGQIPSIGGVGVGVPVGFISTFVFIRCPERIPFAFLTVWLVLPTPTPP